MFNSAITILERYLNEVSLYDLYSIEMRRSDNLEDIYFLCNIADEWYIVLETDYVNSLASAAKEASEIFDIKARHWLAKKDEASDRKRFLPEIEDASMYNVLVLRLANAYIKYAVLAVEPRWRRTGR